MSHNWTLYQALMDHTNKVNASVAGQTLLLEFQRLAKQECAYCNGFGHSANDCPTDLKLQHLRVGVQEQTQYLNELRKLARTKVKMGDVKGFSLLSGQPGIVGNNAYKQTKRRRQ